MNSFGRVPASSQTSFSLLIMQNSGQFLSPDLSICGDWVSALVFFSQGQDTNIVIGSSSDINSFCVILEGDQLAFFETKRTGVESGG
jgi:hypothetical protein